MTENHAYKIMVVEDEAVIALGLQQRLTEMGYDVIGISYSGEEALGKARSLGPDLILMDIMIPGKLDGIDVAEIVKSELGIPVIFLTAFSDDKIIKRAREAEPYGYILKPFQDREIKAAVEIALYKKEMEEALRKSEARYRSVMESQTEMICRFLPDGTLTFVNEAYCRYFDKGREELIGYKFMPLIPEGDREKVFNNIASLNQNAPIITHEHRVLNPSGEMCWHKWTNQAIFDDQNNLTEYQGVGWDITERVKSEEALQKAHNDLDCRVKERTFELSNALKKLKRSETELSQEKLTLEKASRELLETNQAVFVLARNIDKKKEELEKKYFVMCTSKLIPILKRLQKDVYCQKRQADLELMISYLNNITHDSPLHEQIEYHLTEQEMRVAVMVRRGLTSQQIADLLCTSYLTVKTHRQNIRKKLKINNTNINLVSYLKSKLKSDPIQGSEPS